MSSQKIKSEDSSSSRARIVISFKFPIGKEIIVMPITYSKEKKTIVVSHREYLQTMVPTRIDELKENTKSQIKGFVTGSGC